MNVEQLIEATTFGITYFKRPDELRRCIDSIRLAYPNANIDVEDTKGNLSAGRNRLAQRCRTPYYFMLEEDMEIRPTLDIIGMLEILKAGNYLGVSGLVLDRRIHKGYAGNFSFAKEDKKLWTTNSYDLRNAGQHRYLDCAITLNYGLFDTDSYREYPWNEDLPLWEQWDWYYSVHKRGMHRMACSSSVIYHARARPNAEYKQWRRRDFRSEERESIGGRIIQPFGGFDAVRMLMGGTIHKGMYQSIQTAKKLSSVASGGKQPTAIIQVGVGFAPEADELVNSFPESKLIGIDKFCDESYPGTFVSGIISNESHATLHFGNNTNLSSVHKTRSMRKNYCRIKVQPRTLDSILDEFGIDAGPVMLWLDCEGSELDALASGPKAVGLAEWIYVECDGRPAVDGTRRFMAKNGFHFYDKHGCDFIFVRNLPDIDSPVVSHVKMLQDKAKRKIMRRKSVKSQQGS